MGLLNDLRQNEIEYCSQNITYFVEEYGHIEDRNSPEIIVPFKLWKEQKDALKDMVVVWSRVNIVRRNLQIIRGILNQFKKRLFFIRQ